MNQVRLTAALGVLLGCTLVLTAAAYLWFAAGWRRHALPAPQGA